ncbi:ferritin-like domain-containing protein [Halomonas korlensis]|uniref:Ferritin-like metal-binding protein YciE n=1 Tax=Halomonas korlensis TaxID=463301 RepID=A0A1I7FKF9_9GAMM|nr:DUF892 family protein [Halomonas korlensis]SFU36635.1 Ferritin-like metal-binding protein YciE [Halomonas korlensis]
MLIKSIEDLFAHLLSEANSAEKQMIRALPKLARAAEAPRLVEMLSVHLEKTYSHMERVEQAANTLPNIRLSRIKCYAMESLLEDAQEIVEASEKGPVRDAGLIGVLQQVKHYEIATYGTLCTLADQLGDTEATVLLSQILNEEKGADEALTALAKKSINS